MRFEYGRTTSYGAFSDRVDVGAGDQLRAGVGQRSTRLRPNTRYHYRAVATNETGSTRSLDRSFRTTREPTGISIALNPEPRRVGRRPDRRRPHQRHGGRRHPGGARAPGLPVPERLQRGRDDDREQQGHVQLQRRLAVRDHAVTASSRAPRTPDLERHPHGVERAARRHPREPRRPPQGAHRGRDLAPGRRPGACRCRSARRAGAGRSCKRAAPKALDANRSRYRFTVRKPKRKRPAARYRVVVLARDGGAHVPGRSREVRVAPVRSAR